MPAQDRPRSDETVVPHRHGQPSDQVVIFIRVIGCGTRPSNGVRANRRHEIVEEQRERREEHRIVQQRIHPRQLRRHPQHLRRQHRVPQRRLIAYRTEHDGLDPLLAQGLQAILPP